jgi:hypothetical protein
MHMPAIVTKLLALGFGGAFLYGASHFPFHATALAPILLAAGALLAWRPQLCLFVLPALLPILDLAPWTGWFFFAEIDLLLLLTVAIAYWRLDTRSAFARMPALALACMAIITISYVIGMWRGLLPQQAIDANSFTDYLSAYNSLRIAKSWFWAMLLLPIMLSHAGQDLTNIERYFIPGMLTGLALVTCAAIQERWLFPGLMNFSSDYRTTALFSGMHTGGAALDGYLALTFPLLLIWLLAPRSRYKVVLAFMLLAAAGYAGLSTFSRGLYAGYACSLVVIAIFLAVPLLKKKAPIRLPQSAALAGLMVLVLFALIQVFFSSGYRGFAASLLLLLAAGALATVKIPWKLWPTTLLCAIAIEVTLGSLLSLYDTANSIYKPPYVLFFCATLVFAAAIVARNGGIRVCVLLMAFWCMAQSALWIAFHRGAADALPPAALNVAIGLALIALNTMTPLWRADRSSLTLAVASAILLALTVPISASYYAVERFSTIHEDLQNRILHWTQALNMMDRDDITPMLGMGLGKFPATYRWRNRLGELAGAMSYQDEINNRVHNRYLRLSSANYQAGYGEVLRLLQRLPMRPDTRYRLDIDIRSPHQQTALHINICERMLIYPQNCVTASPAVLASGPDWQRWQHHTAQIDSARLGAGHWLERVPTQIDIALTGANTHIDIDNISVRDEISGTDLVRNGTFSDGNDYWFFSSDRYHLPWHVKNLVLNIYFELGWLGVLSFASLLLYSAVHLVAQTGHAGHQGHRAVAYLAALAGFQVVGIFDSLLDVPRLALIFFLLLFVALMLPPRLTSRPSRKSPS